MKKLVSVVALLALVLALAVSAACTGKDNPPQEALSAGQIYDLVKEAGKLGSMTAVPAGDYLDIYGIDASKIAESAWYMSENPSLNADEVAIFKLSDASYANTLADLLNARIARQLQVAETYSPDEAAKLQNAEVVSAGNYVYYCVGAEYDAMMNVLKTNIK